VPEERSQLGERSRQAVLGRAEQQVLDLLLRFGVVVGVLVQLVLEVQSPCQHRVRVVGLRLRTKIVHSYLQVACGSSTTIGHRHLLAPQQ
jgi:hypothetical protein